MVIVIIAGGSGTRLWPLSQADTPKHLLNLTGETSMLQNTYRRATSITDDVYIVTEISHSDGVKSQLPNIDDTHLIVEPGRRGTASCFVLALSRIGASHAPSDEIVFIHADHYITDNVSFATAVTAAARASSQRAAIALVGVTPVHPATGLGYIHYGPKIGEQEGLPVYRVEAFKEKPTAQVAEEFLASGKYLWNQGLFAAPFKIWEDELKKHAPYYYEALLQIQSAAGDEPAIADIYLHLKPDAIDYALSERTKNLIVVPATYDWADIGSFFDLHKILKGSDGNALAGDITLVNCEDSMIHGTTKPIIAIGLSGIVVVDTPEGLLVAAKEQSQLVGELSKQLKAKAQRSNDSSTKR